MPFERLADRAKRRPRRLKRQREYSEAHRQRLTAANCPDRDEIASAAIKVMIDLWAEDRNAMGVRFTHALAVELVARKFSHEATRDKLARMIKARVKQIAKNEA